MRLTDRYILRNFFAMLWVVVFGVAGIYVLADVFGRLDEFMGTTSPVLMASMYYLYAIPRILTLLYPMAVLLAGLLTIMLMTRHNEVLAMRSTGMSPASFIRPFLVAGMAISLIVAACQVSLVPTASAKADYILQVEIRKKTPRGIMHGNRLYYRGRNSIWSTEIESPDGSVLRNVQWMLFDREYEIKASVQAEKAVYTQDEWNFINGFLIRNPGDNNSSSARHFETLSIAPPELPEDFVGIRKPPEETDLVALWHTIRRMRQAGYTADEHKTQFWSRLLYPMLGFTLLLAGLPLVMAKEAGGMVTGLGLGLAMGFMTWSGWNFAVTLAKTGMVPALAAVLFIHGVLSVAGGVLFRRVKF